MSLTLGPDRPDGTAHLVLAEIVTELWEEKLTMRTFVEREMIGESDKFKAVLEQVDLVAPADCGVLIQGETGTGKS